MADCFGNIFQMQELIRPLVTKNKSKIILLVLDGLGGLPAVSGPDEGRTELEAASTPNMDELARKFACGLHFPVAPSITPGSGPGHLGLFGYDPTAFQIGRGILEALGVGLEVAKTDIAIRCNYATISDGLIADRRAGRIPTEQSRRLTALLQENIKEVNEAEITFQPGLEHRMALRIRFPSPLEPGSDRINDTDPQKTGREPLKPVALTTQAERVAEVARVLIESMARVLRDQERANYVLLRGFSQKPDMPDFEQAFGLDPLAIAAYPMYRGVARLVGMKAPELEGDLREELDFLKANYEKHDFFFVHVKKVDSYGEDGNFKAKKEKIEEVDHFIPEILALEPDVLIITGDHSTPAEMKEHSWHPVPVILRSRHVLGGLCSGFSERQCSKGELGMFQAKNLIPLALAHSGRLRKFGA